MKATMVRGLALAGMLAAASSVGAEFTVLGGQLDANDPTSSRLDTGCSGRDLTRRYSVIEPLTVSATGSYTFAGLYAGFGLDVYLAVYEGFDVNQPIVNRIAVLDIADWTLADLPLTAELQQGVQYQLLVSSWCSIEQGPWALAVSGPGAVEAPAVRPNFDFFTRGTFSGQGQVGSSPCGGRAEYHQTVPSRRISTTGTYWLVDASYWLGQSVCVGVYSAPYDPDDAQANLVAVLDGYNTAVELLARKDYYFVALPRFTVEGTGDYLFVIAPPGGVALDASFTGSWYDPATPGQGFFLEVIEATAEVFLGWFSFDFDRPAAPQAAGYGDAGHRWLTAFGPFDGDSASLDIEVTTGGIFNSAMPRPTQVLNGTIDLHLSDCHSGEISFDLGVAERTGAIPIKRLAGTNAESCEITPYQVALPRRVTMRAPQQP